MLSSRLPERWLWLGLLAVPGARAAHVAELPLAPLLVTQVPAAALESPADERERAPLPGSRIVLFDPAQPARPERPLTPGFRAAGRPDLSDDASRFLFVGQRASGECFQVWEQSLAGGEARQVTHGTRDCLEALYLSTLFTLDAEAPRARLCFTRAGEDGNPSLYTCWTDGSDEQRITFQPAGASSPLLLRDGRLLFESGGQGLFTVNVDGTDVQAFAAVDERTAWRSRACETRDGHVLYLETTGTTALVSVSVTRSLRSRTELVPRIAGLAHSLCALEDGTLLVCCKPADGRSTYDLCRLDPLPVRLASTPDWHELDAVPVEARPRRPGRSSVVDASLNDGFLYCLDAGLTDRELAAAARRLEIVAPGTTLGTERVLGSAAVESDGSFYLRVPARTPLRLRLFDEQGRTLGDMQSWIWVMPKEARGCVGCHEDPELTPPNRHVLALRKSPHEIELAR
jgi:hypothetical protein